uniref:Pentatricopeptide repeat-containing protein At2g37320-like n=1 Tax=Rhizophora mucronata TaxID=61149 RepID=A0A2P2JAV7_RHIMU
MVEQTIQNNKNFIKSNVGTVFCSEPVHNILDLNPAIARMCFKSPFFHQFPGFSCLIPTPNTSIKIS